MGHIDNHEKGNYTLAFQDYELLEIYLRALRSQHQHDEALLLITRVLKSTDSKFAPLALALGELSLAVAILDRETTRTLKKGNNRRITIERFVGDTRRLCETAKRHTIWSESSNVGVQVCY